MACYILYYVILYGIIYEQVHLYFFLKIKRKLPDQNDHLSILNDTKTVAGPL
jgi:hypothetical protein